MPNLRKYLHTPHLPKLFVKKQSPAAEATDVPTEPVTDNLVSKCCQVSAVKLPDGTFRCDRCLKQCELVDGTN